MSGPSDDEVMAQAWRDNHASDKPAAPEAARPAPAADDYAGAWDHHSPLDDGPSLDNASKNWNDFKKSHPAAALVASVLPVTGQVTSAVELNDAHNRHDKAGMAMAAAGLVPGVAIVKAGAKAIKAGKAAVGAAKVATGASAEAANAGSNLSDYIHAWREKN